MGWRKGGGPNSAIAVDMIPLYLHFNYGPYKREKWGLLLKWTESLFTRFLYALSITECMSVIYSPYSSTLTRVQINWIRRIIKIITLLYKLAYYYNIVLFNHPCGRWKQITIEEFVTFEIYVCSRMWLKEHPLLVDDSSPALLSCIPLLLFASSF